MFTAGNRTTATERSYVALQSSSFVGEILSVPITPKRKRCDFGDLAEVHHESDLHIKLLDLSVSENPCFIQHEVRTTPVFTREVLENINEQLPQYGLFAEICPQIANVVNHSQSSRMLYLNTNTTFSAVVCGVQGSGKSHTLNTIIENCVIPDERIGYLGTPLSAMVCHFDASGGNRLTTKPCEAVWVATKDHHHHSNIKSGDCSDSKEKIIVFVSPSNYNSMLDIYQGIMEVQVLPLFLSVKDLNVTRMMTLMAMDGQEEAVPLYMQVVQGILRDLGDGFDYEDFKRQLDYLPLTVAQRQPLDMRLKLLEQFLREKVAKCIMAKSSTSLLSQKSTHKSVKSYFQPGFVVIFDMSDPLIDPSFACSMFKILLELYVETPVETGKLVVLDEAHKYMTDSHASKKLSDYLIHLVCQHRHLSMRTVISTQDPITLPVIFLELCSLAVIHRFSSPSWWAHLTKHLASKSILTDELFQKVVQLRTGNALCFAPSGLRVASTAIHGSDWPSTATDGDEPRETSQDPRQEADLGIIAPAVKIDAADAYGERDTAFSRLEAFGVLPILIRIRRRITKDGGASIEACA